MNISDSKSDVEMLLKQVMALHEPTIGGFRMSERGPVTLEATYYGVESLVLTLFFSLLKFIIETSWQA